MAKIVPGAATASPAPPSLTYGAEPVGVSSAAQTVTLTNNGNAALVTSFITASTGFSETDTCGTPVPPGGNCTISVVFTPTFAGLNTGTLTINDNASSTSPQTVTLSGTGGAPVSLQPSVVNFGNQAENTTSSTHTITLRNPQSIALAINNIGASTDYSETNNCGGSVLPHKYCQIFVTFKPTILGPDPGTLTVNDNAPNSPQTASLSGTGVLPVVLSPGTLLFGTLRVGTASTARNLMLTNNLTTSLGIGITFIGANPGDFSESDNCGGSVGTKSHCTLVVTFKPTATGSRSATLTVTDSASNSPQTTALTGTGR